MLSTTPTRYAGSITTENGMIAESLPVVIVNVLGTQVDLEPHEALRIAVRLIECASRADNIRPDDWTAEG